MATRLSADSEERDLRREFKRPALILSLFLRVRKGQVLQEAVACPLHAGKVVPHPTLCISIREFAHP